MRMAASRIRIVFMDVAPPWFPRITRRPAFGFTDRMLKKLQYGQRRELRPLVPPGRAVRARLRRPDFRDRVRRRDGGRAGAFSELYPRCQRPRLARDPARPGARRAPAD